MYSSLNKLDMAVAPAGSSAKLLIQTDHRRPDEISEEAPLSVLFAVTRCLNARRMGEGDAKLQPFRVVYNLDGEVPAFFAYAIAAAGATHWREPVLPSPETTTAELPRFGELEVLVSDAVRQLVRAVRKGRPASPVSLAELTEHEEGIATAGDEKAFYEAVVTLGAFAAEFVRANYPDIRWHYSPESTIPFALGRPGVPPDQRVQVFGLAEHYIEARREGTADATDAPSTLLGIMTGEIREVRL
jgi:hypothetical protein